MLTSTHIELRTLQHDKAYCILDSLSCETLSDYFCLYFRLPGADVL